MDISVNSASSNGNRVTQTSSQQYTYDRSCLQGQALVTVTNDPRADNQAWWGFRVQDNSWKDPPPAMDPLRYPPITRRDLELYLRLVGGGRLRQFCHDRITLQEGMQLGLALEGQGKLAI